MNNKDILPFFTFPPQGLHAALKESESKELVAKLHQERMDGTFQRDMLQYLIRDKGDIDIDDSLLMQRDGEITPAIYDTGIA